MHKTAKAILVFCIWVSSARGKVVVFWQEGFPTLESQPIAQEALQKALDGFQPEFADLDELSNPKTLRDADLLVLPYGSAVPADAWAAVVKHIQAGGNLLVLGGRALTIPVRKQGGGFVASRLEAAYARQIGIEHTYEAPLQSGLKFVWKDATLSGGDVRAKRVFVLEGVNRGLGFLENSAGERVAAPVVAADFLDLEGEARPQPRARAAPPVAVASFLGLESEARTQLGARIVMLGFEPESGYWSSADALGLLRQAADYALQGATLFRVEMQNVTLLAGEIPQAVVRLNNARKQRLGRGQSGMVRLELLAAGHVLSTKQVDCSGDAVAEAVAFQKTLSPGFYEVRGTYEDAGRTREFYQTGFWVRDDTLLRSGSAYGVKGDFLTKDGVFFFPRRQLFHHRALRLGLSWGGQRLGLGARLRRDGATRRHLRPYRGMEQPP
jgi:hypothetical protein